MLEKNTQEVLKDDKIDSWFSGFIDQIKVDHLLVSTKTASPDKMKMYNAFISGDEKAILSQTRNLSSIHFIKNLVFDYISEINHQKKRPLKLALGISDSKILVWSEINDDDEETEDALLMAEARVNNKYYRNGFFISSTIIEKSDNLPIPIHYQNILE